MNPAASEPNESPPDRKASKRRENILIALLALCVLGGGDAFKLLPDSLRSEYTPFVAGLILGFLTSLGVLLSYWWSLRSPGRSGTYFVMLCAFAFLFMASATRGMLILTVAGQTIAEYSAVQQSTCSIEAQLCRQFIVGSDEAKRRSAELFYVRSVNLLDVDNPMQVSQAPTKEAASDRAEQLKAYAQFAEGKRALERVNQLSLWSVFAHLGIAALVFAIGGAVFRFATPRASI